MSFYEWLLFFHLLSAFAFVAAYAVVTVVLVAVWRADSGSSALPFVRLARPADALAWAGATGTLVFGIWLAIDSDVYELWDAWILNAFLFWLVAEEAIRREDLLFRKARRVARTPPMPRATTQCGDLRVVLRSRHALALHLIGSGALLALLGVMIFKPGAG